MLMRSSMCFPKDSIIIESNMGPRLNRLSLRVQVILALFVAYILHYATLPVPDDLNQIDRWTMRFVAMGVDGGRLAEKFETPFRVPIFNSVIWFLGAWGIRDVMHQDTFIDGVKVRIYEPKHKRPGPMAAIIYLHGGGWVYGDTGSYHGLTGYLASELRIVVVSVDYRTPPTHLFPAAIDDSTKAAVWFLQHAAEYNVDPTRIAVVGDSCGGNLAAAVTQRLTFQPKYKHLQKLKFHGLIYPVLQSFDFNLPSYQQSGDKSTLIVRKEMMMEFWSVYMFGDHRLVKHFQTNNHTTAEAKTDSFASKVISHDNLPRQYLYDPYTPPGASRIGNEEVYNQIKETLFDPDFAPLMRENLTGLPPAYVLTAQHDLLRDEDILYTQRLQKAGVDVTWNHYQHGVHGIFSMFAVPGVNIAAGRECMRDFIKYAREKLQCVEDCKL
ncbi:neutral cholesterol ester hydrolase 1-like [Amphiura filiformis]|uniref:neutral cholesterol ester hydrolase 1-like n=1 Tax=Amphiura filiformis TaxID=82378 RepID=UPI003B2239B7